MKEDGHTVLLYHEPSGTIKEVPLGELTPNEVDYLLRGWCQAKLTARLTSGLMKQNPADWRKHNTVMALQPELFKKQMQSLRFTPPLRHRPSVRPSGKSIRGKGANRQTRKLCVCRFFGSVVCESQPHSIWRVTRLVMRVWHWHRQ